MTGETLTQSSSNENKTVLCTIKNKYLSMFALLKGIFQKLFLVKLIGPIVKVCLKGPSTELRACNHEAATARWHQH